jgi:hypothetical protein
MSKNHNFMCSVVIYGNHIMCKHPHTHTTDLQIQKSALQRPEFRNTQTKRVHSTQKAEFEAFVVGAGGGARVTIMDWRNNAQKFFDKSSSFITTASAKISNTISETSLDSFDTMLSSITQPLSPQQSNSELSAAAAVHKKRVQKKQKKLRSRPASCPPESKLEEFPQSFFDAVKDRRIARSNSGDDLVGKKVEDEDEDYDLVEARLKKLDPGLYRKSMQLLHLEELVGLMRLHFKSVSESMMQMTRSGCLLANDVSLFWKSEASENAAHQYHNNPLDYTTLMVDVGANHRLSDVGEGVVHKDVVNPPFDVSQYLGLWLKLDNSATESFYASMQTEIMEEFDAWFEKLTQLKINVDVLIQLRFKVKDLQTQMEKIHERMADEKANSDDDNKLKELEKSFIFTATQYEDVRDDVNGSFKSLVDKRFQIMNRFVAMMADFQKGFFATAYREFSSLEGTPLPYHLSSPETSVYIKHRGLIERSPSPDEAIEVSEQGELTNVSLQGEDDYTISEVSRSYSQDNSIPYAE